MASRTLPVLTHPNFPQVFDQAVTAEMLRVEYALDLCIWESPESSYGACDGGFQCTQPAEVEGYCARHYRQVQRG